MFRRGSVLVAVAVAAVLVVAACGSGDDDAAPASTTTGAPSTTSTTSTTVAPPAATTTTTAAPASTTTTGSPPEDDGVLVELTTSGGLDGRGTGALLVTASGEVTATGRDGQVAHGTLAAGELDALSDLLAGTDFAGLGGDPGPGSTCADAFVYTVRYRQWTAGADDCTTPTELAPVLDRLRDLLTRFT